MALLRSSARTIEFIVLHEVTSRAVYEKLYSRPTWPKGRSGVTIGIGYDLGFQTPASVKKDWGDHLPAEMIIVLGTVCGITGPGGKAAAARIRDRVQVPFEAAMDVFKTKEMPRWEGIVLKALPGSEALPPDCFGALTSLTLNRGPSYSTDGDRYKEMRGIRAALQTGQPQKVPGLIRAMKRIWEDEENSKGLLTRRDAEADMFEAGLRKVTPAVTDISAAAKPPSNVLLMSPKFNIGVQIEQQGLLELEYPELGEPDGKFGGKTRGMITAFMTDRGLPPHDGDRTVEFQQELSKALAEKRAGTWKRPVAEQRKNATVADVAKRVPGVSQNALQKILAWVMGLPAVLIAGLKSLFGNSDDPNSWIDGIKNFFTGIPAEYYLVAVAGICIVIFLSANKSDNSLLKAYQENKIN